MILGDVYISRVDPRSKKLKEMHRKKWKKDSKNSLQELRPIPGGFIGRILNVFLGGGGPRRDAPRIHQGLHAMCGVNRSAGGSGSQEAGGRKCHSMALGEGVDPTPALQLLPLQ